MIQQGNCYRLTKAVSMLVAAFLCSVSLLARAEEPSDRVASAAKVFKELAADKENGLPINILNKSVCVIILPSVKKAGFVVGAQYGRGVMNCRSGEKFDGPWGAPIMMRSSGGSIGLQIGAEATDFVILVMNSGGAKAVMKGRAKLGTDASIAAGPMGKLRKLLRPLRCRPRCFPTLARRGCLAVSPSLEALWPLMTTIR